MCLWVEARAKEALVAVATGAVITTHHAAGAACAIIRVWIAFLHIRAMRLVAGAFLHALRAWSTLFVADHVVAAGHAQIGQQEGGLEGVASRTTQLIWAPIHLVQTFVHGFGDNTILHLVAIVATKADMCLWVEARA